MHVMTMEIPKTTPPCTYIYVYTEREGEKTNQTCVDVKTNTLVRTSSLTICVICLAITFNINLCNPPTCVYNKGERGGADTEGQIEGCPVTDYRCYRGQTEGRVRESEGGSRTDYLPDRDVCNALACGATPNEPP